MLLPVVLVGPPSHIVPYRPVNLLYGVTLVSMRDPAVRVLVSYREYPSART